MPIAQSTGGAQKSVSEIPTMTSYWKDASDFTIMFDSWLANQGKIAQMIWKYELKNTIFIGRKSLFSDQVTPKLWSNEYNAYILLASNSNTTCLNPKSFTLQITLRLIPHASITWFHPEFKSLSIASEI